MNNENQSPPVYQGPIPHLTDEAIRGLKAKLKYQSCDLVCTPINRCDCNQVVEDIKAADIWISHLPGMESFCDG